MFSVQEGEIDSGPKGYIELSVYSSYRSRYKEFIRMLNGLEKSLGVYIGQDLKICVKFFNALL